MGSNDTYSFDSAETVVPSGAATNSTGVSVAAQATRMGLVIVADLTDADPIDGNYTVIIETSTSAAGASANWLENSEDSVTFAAVGTYTIQLVQPIFDQVRARIEADGVTPDAVTLTLNWLSDTSLTSLA